MPLKSVVGINVNIPTVKQMLDYESRGSLRDYDITIFNPMLPWKNRIEFSAGGSCISIEGTKSLLESLTHWSRELTTALTSGKTIFVIMSEYKDDFGAIGSTLKTRTNRTYETMKINNYSAIPMKLNIGNARGRNVIVKDGAYRGLYDSIKSIVEYRVVFENSTGIKPIFTAKDGTVIGGAAQLKDRPGHLVFLPYVDFDQDGLIETTDNDEEVWSDEALASGRAFIGQLVAIDKMLRGASDGTPAPDWLTSIAKPLLIREVEERVNLIDSKITSLRSEREEEERKKADALVYSYLLYENGKPLEAAVQKVMTLLGYNVSTLQAGDLEIDHVITGPSGKRMIGES